MDLIGVFIATGMYSGLLPIVPGAWGSALALLLWRLCRDLALPVYIGIVAGVFVIGCWAAATAESILGQKDASPIVIDEIVGLLLALLLASRIRFGWLFGFLVFLMLDALKPFPASWVDTHLHGGLGIMLDDVVVGVSLQFDQRPGQFSIIFHRRTICMFAFRSPVLPFVCSSSFRS
jgi:phosphatidylglycerophosphatase A